MGLVRVRVSYANHYSELISSNKKLTGVQEQFDVIVEQLTLMKKQREDKEAAKIKRSKPLRLRLRLRKPKRQPITPEIYQMFSKFIILTLKRIKIDVYLRIAFCLLAVTGVRISQLLPLTVSQLDTLLQHIWISINREP